MATTVGVDKGPTPERTAVETFGSGGMALLPWTRQMLTVVWEQLRLLLQVIYYTFMSGKTEPGTLSLLTCCLLCVASGRRSLSMGNTETVSRYMI